MTINRFKLILENWWVYLWMCLVHVLLILYIRYTPANLFTSPVFVAVVYGWIFLSMIGLTLRKPYTIYEAFPFNLARRDMAIVGVGAAIYFATKVLNNGLNFSVAPPAAYTELSIVMMTILGGLLTLLAGSSTAFMIGHVLKILTFAPQRDILIFTPKPQPQDQDTTHAS